MTPRITISMSQAGELEIRFNKAGRDLLVDELKALDEQNEHLHLQPEENTVDVPLRSIPYVPTDDVISWAKIMLRPDELDAKQYPHVLTAAPTEGS